MGLSALPLPKSSDLKVIDGLRMKSKSDLCNVGKILVLKSSVLVQCARNKDYCSKLTHDFCYGERNCYVE